MMNTLFQYLVIIIWIAVTLKVIWYYKKELSKKNGSDIHIIWYLFFLSATIAFFIMNFAIHTGIIGDKGQAQGIYGAKFFMIFNFMTNIEEDLKILTSIFAIIILPQWLSYIFCGTVGCAIKPKFVSWSFKIYIWSVIKSFVTLSGIMIVISMFLAYKGWGFTFQQAFLISAVSLTSLMYAFFLASFYREIPMISSKITDKINSNTRIRKYIENMSRNIQQ